MIQPVHLDVLTTLSNNAREPLTRAIAAGVPGASAHFSRSKVTDISVPAQARGPFADRNLLAAAERLALRGWIKKVAVARPQVASPFGTHRHAAGADPDLVRGGAPLGGRR